MKPFWHGRASNRAPAPPDWFAGRLAEGLAILSADPFPMATLRARNECIAEDLGIDVATALLFERDRMEREGSHFSEQLRRMDELRELLEDLWMGCASSPCWKNNTGVVDPEWQRVRALAQELSPLFPGSEPQGKRGTGSRSG